MTQHIHILGASGSGTTTLGRALAERLNYIHFDTDNYFWLPADYRETRTHRAPTTSDGRPDNS